MFVRTRCFGGVQDQVHQRETGIRMDRVTPERRSMDEGAFDLEKHKFTQHSHASFQTFRCS